MSFNNTKKKRKNVFDLDDLGDLDDLVQLSVIFFVYLFSQIIIAAVHRAAAMSVDMTNLSFNHFENEYVITTYQALHSGYKSSHHKFIAGRLLNKTYEKIKFKINAHLNACNHFSFFIDETVNIRREKMINLCCQVFSEKQRGGDEDFHIKTDVKIVEIMNAEMQTN